MPEDIVRELGQLEGFSGMDDCFRTDGMSSTYAADHARIENATPDYATVDKYDDSINATLIRKSSVF